MSGHAELPAPGDKVRLTRHGREVVAVVNPYCAPYCALNRSVPVRFWSNGAWFGSIAGLNELTCLGSGPPS